MTATTRWPPAPATSGPESIVDTPAIRRCPRRQRLQGQPAHPGVLAQRRRRRARRRRRVAAVLHRRRCRRGAVGDRSARRARQRRPARPRWSASTSPARRRRRPFLDTYEGVRVRVRQVRRGLLRSARSSRSAARRRPTRRCPPTPSPPAAAAWIPHISPAYADIAGEPGRRRPAASAPTRSAQAVVANTDGRGPRVSWASPGSTCSSSTSTSRPEVPG